MAGSDSSGIEEMYRNFGVLADAGDKVSEVCWGGEVQVVQYHLKWLQILNKWTLGTCHPTCRLNGPPPGGMNPHQ